MRKANWLAVPLVLALASCGVFKGGKPKPTTVGERVPVLDSR